MSGCLPEVQLDRCTEGLAELADDSELARASSNGYSIADIPSMVVKKPV